MEERSRGQQLANRTSDRKSREAPLETMKPLFHPQFVNGPFEDPVLYIEFLFERRALLFDLGELYALPPRKVLAVSHIFVSHTHMDHFTGFDRVLRICVGRAKRLHLYGPPRFIEQVGHKLAAYTWNLVQNYAEEFVVAVTEIHQDNRALTAEFHCRKAFARENITETALLDGVLLDEPGFQVRTVMLDHKIPSLAFTLEEKRHINVWKNRLEEWGLPTGPWLKELKDAVVRELPDETEFHVWWRENGVLRERYFPLGVLKENVLHIVPGQKITYVTDVAYHEENARRIVEFARGSDLFFIESTFLHEDVADAKDKAHLTAQQAGLLAHAAGAKRLIPFHFSQKYFDDGQRLQDEAERAFLRGPDDNPGIESQVPSL